MKRIARIGVSLLSLLLLATPIMACLVPAAAMTDAERDCCKRMAHDCGNGGMMKSHSCCQSTTVPSHLATIKSSFDANSMHLGLLFADAFPSMLQIATVPEIALWPARSPSRHATLSIESFDSFVASAAVSIATGWSEPVTGRELHPLKSSAFSRRTFSPIGTIG